jgi:hypothetical protein
MVEGNNRVAFMPLYAIEAGALPMPLRGLRGPVGAEGGLQGLGWGSFSTPSHGGLK